MAEALGRAIGQLLGLGFFTWLIGILVILGIVALITWVVKKIWYAGIGKEKKQPQKRPWHSDDWLTNAQQRQYNRYDYTDPVKPQKGWEYNKTARMWVNGDQLDNEKAKKANEEVRRKWQQLKEEEEAIKEAKTPIYLTAEEKELSKQIYVDRSQPTFEEWKAQQKKNKTE